MSLVNLFEENERKIATPSYITQKRMDLEQIKRIFTYDATPQVFIGNGWVRINGKSFNGITKEDLSKIVEEINNGKQI